MLGNTAVDGRAKRDFVFRRKGWFLSHPVLRSSPLINSRICLATNKAKHGKICPDRQSLSRALRNKLPSNMSYKLISWHLWTRLGAKLVRAAVSRSPYVRWTQRRLRRCSEDEDGARVKFFVCQSVGERSKMWHTIHNYKADILSKCKVKLLVSVTVSRINWDIALSNTWSRKPFFDAGVVCRTSSYLPISQLTPAWQWCWRCSVFNSLMFFFAAFSPLTPLISCLRLALLPVWRCERRVPGLL